MPKREKPHIRTMDAVALSVMPRKFSTVNVTVTPTPTASTVTFIFATNEPLKRAKAARSASSAAIGVPVESVTSQIAESVREAPPELALPSKVTSPQRPTVCMGKGGRCWAVISPSFTLVKQSCYRLKN